MATKWQIGECPLGNYWELFTCFTLCPCVCALSTAWAVLPRCTKNALGFIISWTGDFLRTRNEADLVEDSYSSSQSKPFNISRMRFWEKFSFFNKHLAIVCSVVKLLYPFNESHSRTVNCHEQCLIGDEYFSCIVKKTGNGFDLQLKISYYDEFSFKKKKIIIPIKWDYVETDHMWNFSKKGSLRGPSEFQSAECKQEQARR